MSDGTSMTSVKFIAEIRNVKEVSLVADADLAFWQEQLSREGLFPYNCNGKAELIISATDITWGLRTNELTIGLWICNHQAANSRDGLYLIQAFNSSRLFAWIERTFFHTPYIPGRIQVEDRGLAKLQLSDSQGVILNIHMTENIVSSHASDESWQGAIFLPRDRPHISRQSRFFVAKLGGYTQTYPYVPALNSLTIASRAQPVFQWLLESNMAGKEWRIRNNAIHARSKTFTRD